MHNPRRLAIMQRAAKGMVATRHHEELVKNVQFIQFSLVCGQLGNQPNRLEILDNEL